MSLFRLFAIGLLAVFPLVVAAQQTAFGSGNVDPQAPVEVESDDLRVSEADGTAEFLGNVVIIQGTMRLAAPRVLVVYDEDGERISKMQATGGVTLVSGDDAAEAERADYDIDQGQIVMEGSVLVAQGTSTLSGQRMVVNLDTGNAQMSGRVRTILNPRED
ncbi:lipopolysaccharide transport periplasmic protein LptA [Pseudooceanicola sp.]|uniref:lipopolysaccharide transport periplasmic protein LptA n=1 Tax=Pseudooceanicola sp. TaxID=1914328 RepID=UPI0035C66F0F